MSEELRNIVVNDEETVKYVHKGVNNYEYLDSIGLVERK